MVDAVTDGCRFVFICGGNSDTGMLTNPANQVSILAGFASAYPGSIAYIQGPGEPNNSGSRWGSFVYNGVGPGTDPQGSHTDASAYVQPWISYCNDLVAQSKANSTLAAIKTIGMCCYPACTGGELRLRRRPLLQQQHRRYSGERPDLHGRG